LLFQIYYVYQEVNVVHQDAYIEVLVTTRQITTMC